MPDPLTDEVVSPLTDRMLACFREAVARTTKTPEEMLAKGGETMVYLQLAVAEIDRLKAEVEGLREELRLAYAETVRLAEEARLP